MGSLILCSQERAEHPFYVEELGVHLYTGEELCFVICNHLFVAEEGFINQQLLDFLKKELGYHNLYERLCPKFKDPKKADEILLEILKEIDYCDTGQLNKIKEKMLKRKNMHPAVLLVEKAEYYGKRKRYHVALKYYETILKTYEQQLSDVSFLSGVYGQMADVYVNLFEFFKAAQAYERAYIYEENKNTLKKLYYLTLLDEKIEMSERVQHRISMGDRVKWGETMDDVRMDATTCNEVKELKLLLQKDSTSRTEGVYRLFSEWKEAYREMV